MSSKTQLKEKGKKNNL